jgi:molybdopterin adenylyltransferase
MRVGVLTISDRASRGEREDRSGVEVRAIVERQGWQVVRQAIVSDDEDDVKRILLAWSDSEEVDLILSSGGTGFTRRDRAPEATLAVVERLAPGLAEAMRAASLKKTPHAMLSRSVCGIRGGCLIVNLPGSPRAARENLEVILPALPHAIELLKDGAHAEEGHTWNPPPPQI